jgi:hypothetical protein
MVYHITGPHFENRLHEMLERRPVDWASSFDVELWVLMTFAVNTNAQRQRAVLPRILEVIDLLELQSWEDLMATISTFIWFEYSIEPECLVLKRNIQRQQEKNGKWLPREQES